MKGFLLVALLLAGCVLTAAKVDRRTFSKPAAQSAKLDPLNTVIYELEQTSLHRTSRQTQEPSNLIPVPPSDSECSTRNPHKNKLNQEPQTKPLQMVTPATEVPAQSMQLSVKAEDISNRPEVVPAKPEVVPIKSEVVPVNSEVVPVNSEVVPVNSEVVPVNSEVVPAKPEVVPVKPEVVRAKPKVKQLVKSEVVVDIRPVENEVPVETEERDDAEVAVIRSFGQESSEFLQYPLPEGVTLSPKHGDMPDMAVREELVIPGGSAGNSGEAVGDKASLAIVYTVENNPDEAPNITRARDALLSTTSHSGEFCYTEDYVTCPVPKTAK